MRKEGRKEGREEGRKEGREEGWKGRALIGKIRKKEESITQLRLTD